MRNGTGTRLGVDVGGTFTDVILYDASVEVVKSGKVPTDPARPERGVQQAIVDLVTDAELGMCEYFVHGTTAALNTLLERSGPTVGLLTTRGFRDVLEIRRTDRENPYELLPAPVSPLVPRYLRCPVTERMRADGSVHVELAEDEVRQAFDVFERAGVSVVAIAFLNAYANPAHENAAEAVLREVGFQGEVALSHVVSGEYREYERTATTVVDSYVRGSVRNYLQELGEVLRQRGFDGELLMVRPDGGAITFAEAEERPFETIISGPVGGVQGAAELARLLDLGDVITADVGGTSFDTAVISSGSPQLLYEGKVAGMPIQAAWVDVRSIGAGGGSIAHVDDGGLLRVGPRSSGAYPGPACYGRGGTSATVTDAAFFLGLLPDKLASGLKLDRTKSELALAALATSLELDVQEIAKGVLQVVTAAMAGAMREITVEQGRDPRLATLMAFGGAGPLFSTLLARELELSKIIVPPYAGNFSAWGMLGADLLRAATRTKVLRLADENLPGAEHVLDELFTGLEQRAGRHRQPPIREVSIDMRYVGQEHTITVAVPYRDRHMRADAQAVRELFSDQYITTFSYKLDEPIEMVTFRAALRERLPQRSLSAGATRGGASLQRSWKAYSFARDEWLDFIVIERTSLGPGTVVEGPALVLEETATTFVDADYCGTIEEHGSLVVHASKGME